MKRQEEAAEAGRTGETAAAVVHIIGGALSLAALAILVVRAAGRGSPALIVGFSLCGASLTYYFVISAIAHLLRPPAAKRVFATLDEAGGYFLIAGSWTPLCLHSFAGALGWTLFGLLWGLAIISFLLTITVMGTARSRPMAVYYVAFTLVLPLVNPFRSLLSEAVLAWLVLAGILYTAGLLFRSRGENPYNHAIWHSFTLAAAICHFFALLGL